MDIKEDNVFTVPDGIIFSVNKVLKSSQYPENMYTFLIQNNTCICLMNFYPESNTIYILSFYKKNYLDGKCTHVGYDKKPHDCPCNYNKDILTHKQYITLFYQIYKEMCKALNIGMADGPEEVEMVSTIKAVKDSDINESDKICIGFLKKVLIGFNKVNDDTQLKLEADTCGDINKLVSLYEKLGFIRREESVGEKTKKKKKKKNEKNP